MKCYKRQNEDPTPQNLIALNIAQEELKASREQHIDGIIMRAKAKWNLHGERSSKYFCNLENRHYTEKLIPKLKDDNGKEIYQLNEIMNEQKCFYERLYTTRNPNMDEKSIDAFFPKNKNINTLSERESESLEADISQNECFNVLKNMKKGKSPGSDGFTVEFYLYFWNILKNFMIKSFQDSFNNELLSNSQRLGVITCLPKPGKSKEYMKNWRPISLLNVDYKILSGVISARIKQYLDKLISNCQKGFVSGRQIGECTRLVSDIISELKNRKQTGLILLIDFEKAFDSLEWSFVDKTLSYFNFGTNIRKWVNLFYTEIESFVINNGHCGERFNLSRGVRQGDPLSPYIFILATEIMANAFMNHKDIKGITIDGSEFLISQLADDTTLFLETNEQSFIKCMELLDIFAMISGLRINYTKTLAVKIGLDDNFRYNILGKDIQWQSEGKFTLLGIRYNLDEDDFTKINFEQKIKEFNKCLNTWSSRLLTIYGKICIIKTIALPKLVHLFNSLPNPSADVFKRLEKICFNFIWNGGSEKIKRTTLINTYENGGLRVPNIELFCMAQKTVWVKKLLDDMNFAKWKTLFLSKIEKHGGNYIWLCHDEQPIFLNKLNKFWKDVYTSWNSLTSHYPELDPRVQPLFYNINIKVNNQTVFFEDWLAKGIRYINDILNDDGSFLTNQEFHQKYNINQPFKYISMVHSIPRNWKKRIKDIGETIAETKHNRIIKLKNLKKTSRSFYLDSLSKFATRNVNSESKWNQITDSEIDTKTWTNIYANPSKVTKEFKLRMLQFKIIHRILPLNPWLFKCKLANNKNCTFCHINIETIEHIFSECIIVQNIWLRLYDWLKIKPFSKNEILLGNNEEEHGIENIKLIIKNCIYKAKLKSEVPTFEAICNIIKQRIKLEKNYYDIHIFNKKWEQIMNKIGLQF